MDIELAEMHVAKVVERIGFPVREVRVTPVPLVFFGMQLDGDRLLLGPALVEALTPDALTYGVVSYLKGVRNPKTQKAWPLIAATALSVAAGASVLKTFGLTVAGFLVAVPLTLAAFLVYTLILFIPFQAHRGKAATREALRLAGLAGAEEYVTTTHRYFLNDRAPVERPGGHAPETILKSLRQTAARLGLA